MSEVSDGRMAEEPFSGSWLHLHMGEPPAYISELLRDGRGELADHSATRRARPAWFDPTLYQKAQECFRQNCLTLMTLHLVGLLQILHVPSILDVLIASGKSATREKAFLRYLETLRMVIGWYRGDIFADGQRSCRRMQIVNTRHQRLFRHSAALGVGAPTQYDMVLTQWAFCGYALLRPGPETGLLLQPGYREGLAHFWRCVGYRLGIPDRLNACGPDLPEARRRCAAILHFVMRPLLVDLPTHPRFVAMSTAMLEGVSLIVPPCDNLAHRAIALRLAFPRRHRVARRAWSRLIYWIMRRHHALSCRDTWPGAAVRWLGSLLLYVAVHICAHARFVPWASNVRRRCVTFVWLLLRDAWCAARRLIGAPYCGGWEEQCVHRRPIDDTVALWRQEVMADIKAEIRDGCYGQDDAEGDMAVAAN